MTSARSPIARHRAGRAGPERRTLRWLACVVALVAACSAADPEGGDRGSSPPPDLATASVVRRDLTVTDEHRGTLGYATATPLVAPTEGIVTALPAQGTRVGRGDVLAEIDGVPMRLLYGERPVWRRLEVSARAADDGPDVRQLNDNLAALDIAEREDLPDDHFDWRTRAAVRAWQESLGRPQTGALHLGEIAFLPGAVRVGEAAVHRGASVARGQILATVTGTEQVVSVDVEAADRHAAAVGQQVVVRLPDGVELAAAVRSIGRVGRGTDGSDEIATFPVTIGFDDPPPGGDELAGAPVVVLVDRVLADDVLVVPVGALAAQAGGGYAVERLTAGGGTEPVIVRPGQFALGLVAVSGGLREGDEVVVPS